MSDLFASEASTFRLMRAKFLADANFDLVILVAAKRREPTFDYQTVRTLGAQWWLTGLTSMTTDRTMHQSPRAYETGKGSVWPSRTSKNASPR